MVGTYFYKEVFLFLLSIGYAQNTVVAVACGQGKLGKWGMPGQRGRNYKFNI